MALIQLRRLTRARLGVPMSDQMFTDDVIDDNINLAIETVESEQRWPWQEHVEEVAVDPVEPDIVVGPTWRATRGIYYIAEDNARVEVTLVAPTDIMTWNGTVYAEAPDVWAPVGNRIMIRPLPSGTVTLLHYFYTQPAWLRDDNDQTDIPNQFGGAIVAKAAELLSVREDDRAAAAGHSADYEAWIDRMRRDVRRSTTPVRIRVRPGSWLE